MVLKLSDNPQLVLKATSASTASTVSNNFKEKVTGLMIENCPNIDAQTIVDGIKTYQTTSSPSAQVLKRLRMQLKNYNSTSHTYSYSGTFDELSGYSMVNGFRLSGYDANGNDQTKPSLVGMWHFTDYVDSTMLHTLTGDGTANSGLYSVGEPILSSKYIIDWDDLAVQSVDSSKPNYNPAAAIVLNSKRLGNVYSNTQHFAGSWWITKEDASKIIDIENWFSSLSNVVDTEGIVSNDTTRAYDFTDFNSLSAFSGISTLSVSAFGNNGNLVSVKLPPNLKRISPMAFNNCSSMTTVDIPSTVSAIECSAFNGCESLNLQSLGESILEIDDCAFNGCQNLSFTSLPSNLHYVGNSSFKDCSNLSISELPQNIGFIGSNAFNGCSDMSVLHIMKNDGKVNVLSGAFDNTSCQIYIGGIDNQTSNESAIELMANDSNTAQYHDRTSSWFTKYYSTRINANLYEIQKLVISDGKTIIDTNTQWTSDMTFDTDVAFVSETTSSYPSIVHGSSAVGLGGSGSIGLSAKIGNETIIVTDASETLDGHTHNYRIDIADASVYKDGVKVGSSDEKPTTTYGSITLFGDGTAKFIGESMMNRISRNGTIIHDYVPVRRKSDNMVGFYDVITSTFIGNGDYSSDEVRFTASDGNSNTFATENGLTIEF